MDYQNKKEEIIDERLYKREEEKWEDKPIPDPIEDWDSSYYN